MKNLTEFWKTVETGVASHLILTERQVIDFWVQMAVFTIGCKVRLKSRQVLLDQKFVCEGISKISSSFVLHLIKVGKLRRFKKVSSDLKTILMTDLADLRFLEL